MTRVMWTTCVCALLLTSAARAQFLWQDNFEDNLDHWTVTDGTITLEDGRMRLDVNTGGRALVEADYSVPWPAEGETNSLYFRGLESPGQNATMDLGPAPEGRIQFWYADVQEPHGYFRARLENVYIGGTGCPEPGSDTSLGTTEDEVDFRFVFTGLAGDEVKVDWQWKMSADDEYIPVECGTATLAKADYPDLTVHVSAPARGEEDSTWYVDSVAYESGTAPVCDPGDGDGDGDVDDDDLSLLLANWGSENASCAQGEFSGAAPVNDDDLSLLLANWTGSAAVPEPATMGLLAVGTMLLLRHKRRA